MAIHIWSRCRWWKITTVSSEQRDHDDRAEIEFGVRGAQESMKLELR
jgi:hypothetical protein